MKPTTPQPCEYALGNILDKDGNIKMEIPQEMEEQYREYFEIDPNLAESIKQPVRQLRRGFLWSISVSHITEKDNKGFPITYTEHKGIVEDESSGRLYEIPIEDIVIDRVRKV